MYDVDLNRPYEDIITLMHSLGYLSSVVIGTRLSGDAVYLASFYTDNIQLSAHGTTIQDAIVRAAQRTLHMAVI